MVLGNPPYNGFAGLAVDEERELSDAYRTTKRVRSAGGSRTERPLHPLLPHGGAADRREDGRAWSASSPTTPGSMGCRSRACGSGTSRRSTLIRIDCLNGDKHQDSASYAPDGSPDQRDRLRAPRADPPGIQGRYKHRSALQTPEPQGRLIAPTAHIRVSEHLWGQARAGRTDRQALLDSLGPEDALRHRLGVGTGCCRLGLPFKPMAVSDRMVRLAGAPRPVSGVVSWSPNRSRRIPGRCGSRPASGARPRLLQPRNEPRRDRPALSAHHDGHGPVRCARSARHSSCAWRSARSWIRPVRLSAVRRSVALLGGRHQTASGEKPSLPAARVRRESVALRGSSPATKRRGTAGHLYVTPRFTPPHRVERKHVPRMAP